MGAKTHPFEDEDYEERETERDGDGDGDLSPLPNFTKSPLIITKKMISKTAQNKKKKKNNRQSSILSSSSKSDQTMMSLNRSSNPSTKFNLSSSLGSLMAALPLSPSPVCSSPTATYSSPSSAFPCDYSRASGDFYTPTHQSSSVMSRSMSFKKQSEQSPKCLSISTIYESAKDHVYRGGGFDSHGNGMRNYTYSPKSLPSSAPPHDYYESSSTTTTSSSGHAGGSFPLLPSVPEEMTAFRQRREGGKPDQFARAVPVSTEQEVVVVEEDEEEHPTPVNRPRPYQEFLEEVQKHRRNAEQSARRKAVYTHMLDQLRRKEAAIDDWESNRRSKEELKLEKTERNVEKKRAKALQKMHQKLVEINMEAEKKKAKERRSFLKKMDKLSGQTQPNNKVTATMLWNTWSSCCLPGSQETP